jgi:hypothetical protein
MVGERVKGETELGYAYFKIYRDMEPDDRALSKLCDIAVNGKKRTITVFARWSTTFNWQDRVRDWDVQRSRDSLRQVIHTRNKELIDFINKDFAIAKLAQGIAQRSLVKLFDQDDLDTMAYRQTMLGYREAREFLKELIGVFEANSDQFNKAIL